MRAGEGAAYVTEFINESHVAIGWKDAGIVTATTTDDQLETSFAAAYPDARPGTRRVWLAIVRRFVRELKPGDGAITYDPDRRLYFLGKIESDIEPRPQHELSRMRRVVWTQQVPRDSLTAATRNSLGSIATLFQVTGDARDEVFAKAVLLGAMSPELAVPPAVTRPESDRNVDAARTVLEDDLGRAQLFIDDKIVALAWDDMQELVAAILRAMGYRARVSPPGADRGFDVFASPDGLGLQEPRIFVEVKHRKGKIDAPLLRSFLGGRKPNDRCLYVSTGGFTKEAAYEAERASVPTQLINLERLRELLLEYYDRLAPEAQAMVPLKRVYWPEG